MSEAWYSARVRLVCLTDEADPHLALDTVYMLRAVDKTAALRRAVELARGLEEEYLTDQQLRVRWAVQAVVSLDRLVAESLEGAAVFCEPVRLPDTEALMFKAHFDPLASEPVQTVSKVQEVFANAGRHPRGES